MVLITITIAVGGWTNPFATIADQYVALYMESPDGIEKFFSTDRKLNLRAAAFASGRVGLGLLVSFFINIVITNDITSAMNNLATSLNEFTNNNVTRYVTKIQD